MDSGNEKQIKKTKPLEPSNCFDQLPQEIVLDILSRLPITSLIQFSFVCQSTNVLSRNPLLANMHLSRSLINESSCLIFHSDYPIRNQLHFVQLLDEKVRKFDTPYIISMPEFRIIGSCNGLLCLINSLFSESIYLYNPFIKDYRELPKNFDFQDQIVVYGFGFHPIIDDYKVIKIGYYPNAYHHTMARHFNKFRAANKQSSEVQVYSLSSNTWKGNGFLPYRLEKWSSPGSLVNGRLHWVSQWGKYDGHLDRLIVCCDLADDSFSVIKKPGSVTGSVGRWVSCHLANLGGFLSAAVPVPPGHGNIDIWIMKDYGVNESWVKEYSIGVYYPVSMISQGLERSCHIWRNMFGRKSVQILCVLKSGDVLLEYRGGALVSYNPSTRSFKELWFDGMPRIYQTTVHVGSLKSAVFPL